MVKNPHDYGRNGKEERHRAIEGGKDYAFANLEELFLVPNIITRPKFKVSAFDKYKGTTYLKIIVERWRHMQKMRNCWYISSKKVLQG